MIRNNDPRNRVEAWDLEEDEFALYRGSGRVSAAIGEGNKLLAVAYHSQDTHAAAVVQIREDHQDALFGAVIVDGMMSSYQFCPDDSLA